MRSSLVDSHSVAGKTPYQSQVTFVEEWLPASIGMIGSKGSDVALAELIRDFMSQRNAKTWHQGGPLNVISGQIEQKILDNSG